MMFKDKYIHKLYAFALAAVFTLTLAGCGGGGGGAADDTMTGPTPAEVAATAANEAVMAASDAVAALTQMSTDEEVAAATAAITAAKAAAMHADLTAEDAAAATAAIGEVETALAAANSLIATYREGEAAKMQVAALQEQINALRAQLGLEADDSLSDSITDLQQQAADLQQRIQDEQDAEDKAAMEAMAAAGKALHGALGATPLSNIDSTATALAATGLTIDQVLTADDPGPVTLEADDAAGALGSWNGMNYALTADDTSHTAVIYTNRAAPGSQSFADSLPDGTTLNADGALATPTAANAMADAFTHSGTQTHTVPEMSDAVYIRGTYNGAPGTYRCAGTDCTSTNDGKGSPSALGGTWTFTPDEGAMVPEPDANYLFFGWWLRKDDGKPTSASAFFGTVGTAPTTPDVTGTGFAGSATYSGGAAGKFAINNPLGGSNAGHFTADVMLTAKFGAVAAPNNGGMSGTIDNFRLNDGSEDPGWSVELKRAPWGSTGAFATTDGETGTVWSIGGNAAAASGTWNGQVYDEMPPGASNDDGSNLPTTATGVFQSTFGSTHTMVGGFGANKE